MHNESAGKTAESKKRYASSLPSFRFRAKTPKMTIHKKLNEKKKQGNFSIKSEKCIFMLHVSCLEKDTLLDRKIFTMTASQGRERVKAAGGGIPIRSPLNASGKVRP